MPSLTTAAGDSEGAKLDAHARQTRLIFNTTTPTDSGTPVKGHVEFDMMSTVGGDERITNGYTPSIRLSLSGKIALLGNNDLRFTLNTGDGIGRYLALNTFNDSVLTAAGADAELESISATGASLA